MAAVPHSWDSIRARASRLKLCRTYRAPRNLNPIIQTLLDQREAAGIAQQHVADKIGVARATLCRFETGKALPRLTDLQPWCEAVGLELTVVAISSIQKSEAA
jgi:DNA-binding XRE family transcriptional regulator